MSEATERNETEAPTTVDPRALLAEWANSSSRSLGGHGQLFGFTVGDPR